MTQKQKINLFSDLFFGVHYEKANSDLAVDIKVELLNSIRESLKENNFKKSGFVLHDFKDGAVLAISSKGRLVFSLDEKTKPFEEVVAITKNDMKFFTHNGETINVTNGWGTWNRLMKNLDNKNIRVAEAAVAFFDNDIYFDNESIYIPGTIENHKDIIVLMVAHQPKRVAGSLTVTEIFKDTGITIDYLKESKAFVTACFANYGVKPLGTLKVMDSDDKLILTYTRNMRKETSGFVSVKNFYVL